MAQGSPNISGRNISGHGASLKSWLAALVILAGFIVGGIALIYWNWPVFWIGVAIAVIGGLIGWAVGIMNDVTEYGGGPAAGNEAKTAQ